MNHILLIHCNTNFGIPLQSCVPSPSRSASETLQPHSPGVIFLGSKMHKSATGWVLMLQYLCRRAMANGASTLRTHQNNTHQTSIPHKTSSDTHMSNIALHPARRTHATCGRSHPAASRIPKKHPLLRDKAAATRSTFSHFSPSI